MVSTRFEKSLKIVIPLKALEMKKKTMVFALKVLGV